MTGIPERSGSEPGRFTGHAETSPGRYPDLEALYAAHSPRLVHSLAARTGSRETAWDIVQESFARFFRLTSRERFEIANPEAYLRRISTNLLRDWGSSEFSRRAKLEQYERDGPDHLDQVAYLESRDILRRLEAAIRSLKPRTRAIFLAHRLEGLTYAEIAERTGLSVKAVEKQMSKAIARLDRMQDRS